MRLREQDVKLEQYVAFDVLRLDGHDRGTTQRDLPIHSMDSHDATTSVIIGAIRGAAITITL